MARTYETSDLLLSAPNSLAWGLAWYRFLANDKPVNNTYPSFSLDDAEIEGLLQVSSVVLDGSRYYMPHEALIMRIMSDPSYAVQISEESYSQTFTSPNKLAENIRSVAARHLMNEYPAEMAVLLGFTKIRLTPRF